MGFSVQFSFQRPLLNLQATAPCSQDQYLRSKEKSQSGRRILRPTFLLLLPLRRARRICCSFFSMTSATVHRALSAAPSARQRSKCSLIVDYSTQNFIRQRCVPRLGPLCFRDVTITRFTPGRLWKWPPVILDTIRSTEKTRRA